MVGARVYDRAYSTLGGVYPMSVTDRIGRTLNSLESRWSLWLLIKASGVLASFAVPAWAVRSMEVFKAYAPLSWVMAGFVGLVLSSLIYAVFNWGWRVRIRARYDAKYLSSGLRINPLDRIFEGKRIFLNEFALPSHTIIEGKTFVDCEIIGPANIYFYDGNQATDIKSPRFDAVYLEP